jgi:hypothetical protein
MEAADFSKPVAFPPEFLQIAAPAHSFPQKAGIKSAFTGLAP